MRLKFIAFLAFAVFVLSRLSFAQEGSISIHSKVDKSTITIGDLVTYSIIVTHDAGVQVELPELGANLGAFEIRDYTVHEPFIENSKSVEQFDYIISTFDVGEFEIPPLSFYYSFPPDSIKHELKTKKLKILVESMRPSEEGDIRDIKAPLVLPKDYRKWIIWGSIGFAAILFAGILFYIWRRKRAGKGLLPEKIKPPHPPHEIALQELTALKGSSLLQEGKVKEFYIRISEVIRRYVEGRYFIVAMELTTFELIENLERSEISAEEISMFQEFLSTCDLVKFAKYTPTSAKNLVNLDKAFEIVECTKLIYEEPEKTEGPPKVESLINHEEHLAEPVEEQG
ncbi:MAG: hypothetical protein E2O77_07145 [Caldithrix sp.]|nr:MAG: hypothetical protein E2O77_07145 [Caldithrix sp.]